MLHFSLENLRLASLTHLETGQLIKRHLADLATLASPMDEVLRAYLSKLIHYSSLFDKSLLQLRKNEETEKIHLQDAARDKAIAFFTRALNVYELSDDPKELEAYKSLALLLKVFKGLGALNYEAETNGIDNLLQDLGKIEYLAKVEVMQLGRFVERLAKENEKFKVLFSNRLMIESQKEHFDTKKIRKEMLDEYSKFTNYLLVMAQNTNTVEYINRLNIINIGRKYYADLLAKRKGTKEKGKEPEQA